MSSPPFLMPGHFHGGIFTPLPGLVGGEVRDGFVLPGLDGVHGQDGVGVADQDRDFPGHETSLQDLVSTSTWWWTSHHQTVAVVAVAEVAARWRCWR